MGSSVRIGMSQDTQCPMSQRLSTAEMRYIQEGNATVSWGAQMEPPKQTLNNRFTWYHWRQDALDGFHRKEDSELLDSITIATWTLVTLGKFFTSFCLVLSLTSHMTCEVQLLTLNGTSGNRKRVFFFLLYSFVFVGKYPHTQN